MESCIAIVSILTEKNMQFGRPITEIFNFKEGSRFIAATVKIPALTGSGSATLTKSITKLDVKSKDGTSQYCVWIRNKLFLRKNGRSTLECRMENLSLYCRTQRHIFWKIVQKWTRHYRKFLGTQVEYEITGLFHTSHPNKLFHLQYILVSENNKCLNHGE